VHGGAGDLVVGVAHGFFEEVADVAAPDPVQHSTTVAGAFDQASQAQLRQMLARYGGAAPSSGRQRGDVGLVVSQRPEHAYPGPVSEHGEGNHSSIHLSIRWHIGMQAWHGNGSRAVHTWRR